MTVFQVFITCERTNNANNATHHVKRGKKRRKSSKRNYYIISPTVIIKAIIVRTMQRKIVLPTGAAIGERLMTYIIDSCNG